MALINCPECGRERVSSSADICPVCSFKISEWYEAEQKKATILQQKARLEEEQKRLEKIQAERIKERQKRKEARKWSKRKKITVIVVIIFLLVLGIGVTGGILYTKSDEYYYRKAESYYKNGKYEETIEMIMNIKQPLDKVSELKYDAYYSLAKEYLEACDYEKALENAQVLESQVDGYFLINDIWKNWSINLHNSGNYKDAFIIIIKWEDDNQQVNNIESVNSYYGKDDALKLQKIYTETAIELESIKRDCIEKSFDDIFNQALVLIDDGNLNAAEKVLSSLMEYQDATELQELYDTVELCKDMPEKWYYGGLGQYEYGFYIKGLTLIVDVDSGSDRMPIGEYRMKKGGAWKSNLEEGELPIIILEETKYELHLFDDWSGYVWNNEKSWNNGDICGGETRVEGYIADYNESKKAKKESEPVNPAIGMTKSEVENSTWGKPNDINKTTYSWGVKEQWCYSGYRYIYFEDGVVTAIQE